MFPYLKKYWHTGLLAILFLVAEIVIDLYQPRMMALIVNEGILGLSNSGIPDLHLIITTGTKMLALVLVCGLCGLLSAVFTNITGQGSTNEIRKRCFDRIMHFSFDQTDNFSTGSLITRVTNDVTQIQRFITQMIRGLTRCVMFFIGGTAALLTLDTSFGVIVACALPLILLDIIFVLWRTNPLFTVLQESLDRLNGIIQEDVAGIRVVKAFIQEKREEQRFDEANLHLVDTQFNVQMLLACLRPVMNIVLNLAVVGIIYVGSVQVQAGDLAPGTVMAAITYLSQILVGMMMLAMIFQTISRGMASTRRVQAVIETESEIRREANRDGSLPQEDGSRGTVRFENVSFVYHDTGSEILHDISFSVASGETFAIIGSTGCGKTSLVSLIPRFYDAAEGRVLVDGVDVRAYDPTVLREKVTVCLQKSELFSTTIRDNILLGRPDATEDAVRAAAASAQADAFILQQPEGYDTPVAERGMSLSGGQRQRIAIARVLLKRGEILIFDDSTSALDLKTEAELYAALDRDYADVTRIIIAQRIASVRNADRILVLDRGTVAALGSHDELMASSQVYRDIYDSQLREEVSA
ncbi:MAG: ABC transporter ATP-binding protein/permease [Oscillospiraceae bacterium]|nr:ABC transporter ATP-binding protein/permease [Oscillospiraceae bacterium]